MCVAPRHWKLKYPTRTYLYLFLQLFSSLQHEPHTTLYFCITVRNRSPYFVTLPFTYFSRGKMRLHALKPKLYDHNNVFLGTLSTKRERFTKEKRASDRHIPVTLAPYAKRNETHELHTWYSDIAQLQAVRANQLTLVQLRVEQQVQHVQMATTMPKTEKYPSDDEEEADNVVKHPLVCNLYAKSNTIVVNVKTNKIE